MPHERKAGNKNNSKQSSSGLYTINALNPPLCHRFNNALCVKNIKYIQKHNACYCNINILIFKSYSSTQYDLLYHTKTMKYFTISLQSVNQCTDMILSKLEFIFRLNISNTHSSSHTKWKEKYEKIKIKIKMIWNRDLSRENLTVT